jgi:hypothetical protein
MSDPRLLNCIIAGLIIIIIYSVIRFKTIIRKPKKKNVPIRKIESPDTDEFYNFSIKQKTS